MHKLTKEQEERFDNEFGVKYTTSYFKNLAAQIKSFLASELAAQRESIAKMVEDMTSSVSDEENWAYQEAARIIRNNTEEV